MSSRSVRASLVQMQGIAPLHGAGMLAGSAALLVCGALAAPVAAQTALDEAVFNRPRPDFAAQCIRVGVRPPIEEGGFLICPSVNMTAAYDDNVFRTEDNAESDLFSRFEPTVDVSSDWERHAVSFGADAVVTRFADFNRNDSTDYELRGSGRFDVAEEVALVAAASWGRFHVDREDPDSAGAADALDEFSRTTGTLSASYAAGSIGLRLAGTVRQLDFFDNGAIDNDDQDRDEYELAVRASLALGSGITMFVAPSYNIRRYDRTPDSSGDIRDSDGYDVRGGISYDISGVTFLELSAGAFEQRFDDPQFSDSSGLSFGGRLVWNITDLQTLDLSLNRSIDESTQVGVSNTVNTNARLGIDFDLSDNLLLRTRASYRNADFESGGREDDTLSGGVTMTYFVNEYLSTSASYDYTRRRSNAVGQDFEANVLRFSLRAQL